MRRRRGGGSCEKRGAGRRGGTGGGAARRRGSPSVAGLKCEDVVEWDVSVAPGVPACDRPKKGGLVG